MSDPNKAVKIVSVKLQKKQDIANYKALRLKLLKRNKAPTTFSQWLRRKMHDAVN